MHAGVGVVVVAHVVLLLVLAFGHGLDLICC